MKKNDDDKIYIIIMDLIVLLLFGIIFVFSFKENNRIGCIVVCVLVIIVMGLITKCVKNNIDNDKIIDIFSKLIAFIMIFIPLSVILHCVDKTEYDNSTGCIVAFVSIIITIAFEATEWFPIIITIFHKITKRILIEVEDIHNICKLLPYLLTLVLLMIFILKFDKINFASFKSNTFCMKCILGYCISYFLRSITP